MLSVVGGCDFYPCQLLRCGAELVHMAGGAHAVGVDHGGAIGGFVAIFWRGGSGGLVRAGAGFAG